MKKMILILLLAYGTLLHATSCDSKLKDFWQKYNGLSFLENVRNGNELAAQLLGMEFAFYDMGNKMNQAFGGIPLNGSGYLGGYLASIREACGGTNYEIREAISDADARFKSLYDQYYSVYLQGKKKGNVFSSQKKTLPENPPLSTMTHGDFAGNMSMVNFNDNSNTATIELFSGYKKCKLSVSRSGNVNKGNCKYMVNSKGIKIYCTPKKKICKTYKEVYDFAFSRGYKEPVTEQSLNLEGRAMRSCQSVYGSKNCDYKLTTQEMKDMIKECQDLYPSKAERKESCGG